MCAFNASLYAYISLKLQAVSTLLQLLQTLLQYGWMLRPFLARDSIQSLQLFNAKSQPRPWKFKKILKIWKRVKSWRLFFSEKRVKSWRFFWKKSEKLEVVFLKKSKNLEVVFLKESEKAGNCFFSLLLLLWKVKKK